MTTSQPSTWWGGQGRGENRLSLLDLIRANTLDIQTAALLWELVEQKTSIIVASSPQRAGKTTLLSALIDFMPPQIEKIYTRGIHEDFSFLNETKPENTCILIPELSDHTPAYLWGDKIVTLFDTLAQGYSMAATMHADSPQQVSRLLGSYPVYIPAEHLHHIGVVVNILLMTGKDDLARRVNRISRVTPGPNFDTLTTWDEASDTFMQPASSEANLSDKSKTLEAWLSEGQLTADEVKELVTNYYK